MTPEQKRQAVCELAASQEGVIGADRYWREVLGPKWQGPYPRHWCGAFALWALRQTLGCDCMWEIDGITNNKKRSGFLWQLRPATDPQPGDICYSDLPYQHHAVLLAIGEQDNGKRFTISQDGNQGAAPGKCLRIYRKLPKWSAIYSIESLL
jgi:hypothetical protein